MGYSNRISKMHTCFYGLSFYGLFTAFVPTFTDFYRLLQTFIEFTDFY